MEEVGLGCILKNDYNLAKQRATERSSWMRTVAKAQKGSEYWVFKCSG